MKSANMWTPQANTVTCCSRMKFATHGFLALIYTLLVCKTSVAVYLRGRPSSQTSSYGDYSQAYKALDGTRETCAMTEDSAHPWWRVDMLEEYCVGTITVVNRADCCAERLAGATVRAGLSPTVTENHVCGSPVTAQQATPGAWLRFTCDPPVMARYLSVDIDMRGTGRTQILMVCEVMVEEASATECPGWSANATGFLDVTCMTPTPRLDPDDTSTFIGAYLGARDATASVSFGRSCGTGHHGEPGLPESAFEVPHPSTDADLLYMPEAEDLDRYGVFYCLATEGERSTKVPIIIQNKRDVHVRPVVLTKTVNVLEPVTLEMQAAENPPTTEWCWRHNAGPFISRSEGKLYHHIPSACTGDAGIYECHLLHLRPEQRHAVMKLIVRGCPAGRWGPDVACANVCPSCYNGGICDDKLGRCVCAPGFKGRYCEEVLGRNFFGQDGSHYCQATSKDDGSGCQGKLFCLPDPYGCSCGAGYKGYDCMEECEEGTYGADCKQTCHCAQNVTCKKDTGECLGDCALSYFGVNCQQTACPVGFFGVNCNQTCHCQSATCHQDTGECEGPCAEPYFGVYCQETGYDGVSDLVAYPSDTTPGHLILAWGQDSASFYTVAYELLNRGNCEAVAAPERKFLPDRFDKETTHAVLTDLEPSSVYRVYVQSHYGVHSIVPTESFLEVSTPPADDPRLVEDLRASNVTSNGFLLSWSAVQCTNAYYLTSDLLQRGHCPRSETPPERSTVSTQDTSVGISCQEPFATYNVSVVASVGGVNGSATTLEVTTAKAAPGAPGGLAVASATPNSLHFTWDDLPCEEHHGQLEGYRYALRDASTEDTVAAGTATGSEVGFTDLTPCKRYELAIAALASGKQGSYSPWLAAETTALVPGPVSTLMVNDSSSTETTVSWQAPVLYTCGVTGYRLRYRLILRDMCSTIASTASPPVAMPTSTTSTRLTGLVPASQYQAFVRGTNAAGEGPETSVVWTTNESAPTQPPQDVMVLGITANLSLGFSWSQPPCGARGGVITKYAYRLSYRDGEAVRTVSAGETPREWVVFAELVPSREYGFQVAAGTNVEVGPYSQIIQATINPGQDESAEKRMITKSQGAANLPDGDEVRPLPPSKSIGSAAGSSGAAIAVVVAVVLLVAVLALAAYIKLRRGSGGFPMFTHRVGWKSFAKDEDSIMTEMDTRGQ